MSATDPEAVVHRVDASGLHCPQPLRALAGAIGDVAVGTIVELTATDPTARIDVPVWCRLQRHRLREATEVEGAWRFRVERTR